MKNVFEVGVCVKTNFIENLVGFFVDLFKLAEHLQFGSNF